jgi:4-carboxymuconolactone decarboxylase
VDYTERLRHLAINDDQAAGGDATPYAMEPCDLDPRTLALVQLAALIAVGGEVPSYGAHADAAVGAGATSDEIVDVLVALVPIVGLPRVVAAAPRLAMALGYDTEDALD